MFMRSESFPLLVVMIITPLAPLDPYRAVAVASLSAEKDLIVSGAMEFSIVALISTPSITMRGEVLVPNVDIPLIQKFAPSAPGSPLLCVEMTPAIFPANEVVRLLEG